MASRAKRALRVVVLGTDFSAASRSALTRAIQIAGQHGAAVHVVHAAPRIPRALARRFSIADDRKLHEALDRVVEQLRQSDIPGRGHLMQGNPVKALTVKARALAADLVIVGTRGRTVSDVVLGSTAERLAAYDRHRVLLVRRASARPYRKVFIAASEDSELAAQLAGAALFSADPPSVIHAYQGAYETSLILHGAAGIELASYRAGARREAKASMVKLLEKVGLDRGRLVLVHGNPVQVLRRIPRDSLLVLNRGRSTLRHVLLGSITRLLIEHGECDVLLV